MSASFCNYVSKMQVSSVDFLIVLQTVTIKNYCIIFELELINVELLLLLKSLQFTKIEAMAE